MGGLPYWGADIAKKYILLHQQMHLSIEELNRMYMGIRHKRG
jgi:hypothetical protein